jgi:hypothetical protein
MCQPFPANVQKLNYNKPLLAEGLIRTVLIMGIFSRLGGVVVSVLATGPKSCGFKRGQEDGFLRAMKIRSTPSFGWEVKPESPMS